MRMLQTFFDYPVDCKYTWFSNDVVTRRVRDYVLAEEFVKKYTNDCSVDDSFDVESDHRIIVTEQPTIKASALDETDN